MTMLTVQKRKRILRKILLVFSLLLIPSVSMAANTKSLDLERGSSQYAYVANDLGIGNGAISLCVWFNPESTPSGYNTTIAHKGDTDTDVAYSLWYWDNGGNVTVSAIRERGGVTTVRANYIQTLSNGTWYHICGTYDTTDIELFINGTSVVSAAATGNGSSFISDDAAVGVDLDSGLGSPAGYADGKVDEYVVYSVDIGSSGVSALYSDPCTVSQTNLAGWWQFEDNYEDSKNTNDMTAVGSPVFSSSVMNACAGGGGGGGSSLATSTSELTEAEYWGLVLLIIMCSFMGLDFIRRTIHKVQ